MPRPEGVHDDARERDERHHLIWSLVGAACALVPVLLLLEIAESRLFLASVGGTSVVVFLLTEAPAAQPRAVVVGHVGSTLAGLIALQWLGPGLPAMLVGTVAAMALMSATRSVHPPAGANPLLVVHAQAGWSALGFPVAACLLVILTVAYGWSRLRPGVRYPVRWSEPSAVPRKHHARGTGELR